MSVTMRPYGWGRQDIGFDYGEAGEDASMAFVADALGVSKDAVKAGPDVADIQIPTCALGEADLEALVAMLGADNVAADHTSRVAAARGQSYHDLLHFRSGQLDVAPDAVVRPGSEEAVVELLAWAREQKVTVVTRGGGTSVVGGVTARRGAHARAVIVLSTARLTALPEVDRKNAVATAGAGLFGPDLESALNEQGVTLGHYPQSFEFSTLGGWVAARGAGQQSNCYGSAPKWFVSARLATPDGIWESEQVPASAAGPRLGDLLVGSEGVLGVITQVTFRVHPVPAERDYRGYLFCDFDAGMEAVRAITQAGTAVATLRLSDADETHFQGSFARLGKPGGWVSRLLKAYLKFRNVGDRPCLLIVGCEGSKASVRSAADTVAKLAGKSGGVALGRAPGRSWYAGRFMAPYLRDPLLDRGIGVETLETATQWSKLGELHQALREAITSASGGSVIVMCHVSHTYRDGASLYVTMVFPMADKPLEQWQAMKRAASHAIAECGATISHHHGVGEDHREWMAIEKGSSGMNVLEAVKNQMDPDHVLNPGKLLPDKSP